MACLRWTYVVVVTLLGLIVLIGLGGRFVQDDFPASGYVLLSIGAFPVSTGSWNGAVRGPELPYVRKRTASTGVTSRGPG